MLNPDPHPASAALLATRPPRTLLAFALVMLAVAAATILGALGFEYIGHYQPCALCLMQRTPYYVGLPVAALAVLGAWLGWPRPVMVVLFAAFALLMLYGGGIAVYHSGVEWKFWEGPAACAPTPGATSAADMLSQLGKVTPPSCTDAVWRLFGLSFAGWNVLISAALVALGFVAAHRAWRQG